jgi:hypothetical protein
LPASCSLREQALMYFSSGKTQNQSSNPTMNHRFFFLKFPPFFGPNGPPTLSYNLSLPNATSATLRKLVTPWSTTARITFRYPCRSRIYIWRSIFSPFGGSSGVLSSKALSSGRVGMVVVSRVLMTAMRKSGCGRADFLIGVEGLKTCRITR